MSGGSFRLLMIGLIIGALLAEALGILGRISTDRNISLHLHTQMLLHKVDCCKDRREAVPLAAPGAVDLTDLCQSRRGHPVAQTPNLRVQRRGLVDDGQEDSRADARTAGTPEAADAAGHLLAPEEHLHQSILQVDVTAGILVGRQQCRTHHGVAFL